ncbi:hypothetical protein RM550_35825 [Streptomyces sp. DSM 41527]|uniref:Uncharacterized protein n=1 Tax=Streptomyces mooreae TaxID=3075523 RepID=A0ABU2TJA0_9ACTN|nr:hypothetical protein [Streptomyces sp. DSM 41527]MDT0461019.1 hypothetical protein [Streptomyces sp. DSM 41527]
MTLPIDLERLRELHDKVVAQMKARGKDAFGQPSAEAGAGEGGFGEPVSCRQLVDQVLQLARIDRDPGGKNLQSDALASGAEFARSAHLCGRRQGEQPGSCGGFGLAELLVRDNFLGPAGELGLHLLAEGERARPTRW